MSNPLFNPLLGNLQQVLSVRLRQHGLSASNIANSSTPENKAERVDFASAFGRIFDATSDDVALQRTDPRHMSAGGGSAVPTETIAAPAWSEDGNSVNAEEEMMILAENNLQFNATVELLSRQLALLEYAASDGGK